MEISSCRDRVLDTLEDLPLDSKLEVLANVFICLGVQCFTEDGYEGPLDPESVIGLLTKKGSNQFELGKSLSNQGILLLGWLECCKKGNEVAE